MSEITNENAIGLFDVMRRFGVSPNRLARTAGISEGTIRAFRDNPEREFNLGTLKKISRAFLELGVPAETIDRLFTPATAVSELGEPVPNVAGRGRAGESRQYGGEEMQNTISLPSAMAIIPEVDVRVAAGDGTMVQEEAIVNHWVMPRSFIRAKSAATPEHLRIVQVVGDSMAPDFLPGDRVMVDTSDRMPTPPGVFVIWDGMGQVIKRVDYYHSDEVPMVKLISRNEEYEARMEPLASVYINGRVIGKWMWT